MLNDNYYKLLRVTKSATIKEIKESYRKLALIFHPDQNSNKDADVQFKAITIAYKAVMAEKEKGEKKLSRFESFKQSGFIENVEEFDVRIQNEWHTRFSALMKMPPSSINSKHLNELGLNESTFVGDKVIDTIQSFKKAQNSLNIKPNFSIPYQDHRFTDDVWGLKLGLVYQNIRLYQYLPDYKKRLIDLGVNYVYSSTDIISALTQHCAVNQSVDISPEYVIPFQNPNFAANFWGMPLGRIVQNIKQGKELVEHKRVLLKLGFTFDNNTTRFSSSRMN